jgi:DNA-binding transcriptional ArsR family regulator
MGEPARKRDTEQAPEGRPAWAYEDASHDGFAMPAIRELSAWLRGAPGLGSKIARDLLAAVAYEASKPLGYCCARQTTLARLIGDRSERTVRDHIRELERAGYVFTVDRQGTNATFVNFAKIREALAELRGVTPIPAGRTGAAAGPSYYSRFKKEKQQSARPPERPPAPACEVVPPAAAAPCVAPVPSVESVAPVALASIEPAKPEVPPAAHPEAPRSLGGSEPVPHPIAPSPAPSRAVLDAGTAHPEPGTSIAVIVDPDDARIMELDGPRRQLAKCQPLAVEPPPALLAKVLREHGPDAGVDVAEVLRSPEARAHPRAALEALEALAAKPASQIARSAGGYYRGLLRVAIRGELRRPNSLGSGWSAMGRLQNAREAAEQRQAWEEAAELREQAVEVSARARAALEALERQDRAHQGVERTIASCRTGEPAQLGGTQLAPPPVCPVAEAARMPPPRALAGPREMPAGVPRTNRALFRVPDD